VLVKGSLPPVWTSLYSDRALIRKFPYLPALKRAILSARPRPQSPSYSQLSLAISGTVHQALVLGWPAGEFVVESLGTASSVKAGKIKEVQLLGTDKKLKWKQVADGLRVELPNEYHPKADYAAALKIFLT